MAINPQQILHILDRCCDSFTFPMLDNGYVYLAATRLSLYRSDSDWAIAIEVFGFSPRAELPDTSIKTFASRLHNRNMLANYVTRDAYVRYLADNPHNEYRTVFPINEGSWQDSDELEFVDENATEIVVRQQAISLPREADYDLYGIELEQAPRVQVFELCRYLAETAREKILATPSERRVSILPEMNQILQLEEWHHPNLVEGERPGDSQTFQQLADVLASGDIRLYRPSQPPNTHWSNWPEGGRL